MEKTTTRSKRPRGKNMPARTRAAATPFLSPAVPDEPIYRLSVAQYHQMIEAGIIDEDASVELLDGWLAQKMGKTPPHTLATEQLRDLLAALLPTSYFVNTQGPVTIDTSEPEPDVMVIRGKRRDYAKRNPGPKDAVLLAEVADSSLRRDQGWKKRLYARARVAVYWIVNLVDRQVEVYTEPTGPGKQPDYRRRTDYKSGDKVPVVIAGREVGCILVDELL